MTDGALHDLLQLSLRPAQKLIPCAHLPFEPGSVFFLGLDDGRSSQKAWFSSFWFPVTRWYPFLSFLEWPKTRFFGFWRAFRLSFGLLFSRCCLYCIAWAGVRDGRTITGRNASRRFMLIIVRTFSSCCWWVAYFHYMEVISQGCDGRVVDECIWFHNWGFYFLQYVNARWGAVLLSTIRRCGRCLT